MLFLKNVITEEPYPRARRSLCSISLWAGLGGATRSSGRRDPSANEAEAQSIGHLSFRRGRRCFFESSTIDSALRLFTLLQRISTKNMNTTVDH